MKKVTNECVGCPPEMGCLGSSCRYMNVESYYCDQCGNVAEYTIDGEDYCEECATEYMKEAFNNCSLSEMADMLDIYLGKID
jgi:hypothetical protein